MFQITCPAPTASLLPQASRSHPCVPTPFALQLQNLLRDFKQPVRVEVSNVEPADRPNNTEIEFMTFDVSQTEHLLLPAEQQLEYIRLLNDSSIQITDSGIYWDSESSRTQLLKALILLILVTPPST